MTQQSKEAKSTPLYALTSEKSRSEAITRLNDDFRTSLKQDSNHSLMITPNVQSLARQDPQGMALLLGSLRRYHIAPGFTEDNDPHGEHDFGAIHLGHKKFFWKIDYYDKTLTEWCDPLDKGCVRVLTLMEASEY